MVKFIYNIAKQEQCQLNLNAVSIFSGIPIIKSITDDTDPEIKKFIGISL